jgi:hypothetical protein
MELGDGAKLVVDSAKDVISGSRRKPANDGDIDFIKAVFGKREKGITTTKGFKLRNTMDDGGNKIKSVITRRETRNNRGEGEVKEWMHFREKESVSGRGVAIGDFGFGINKDTLLNDIKSRTRRRGTRGDNRKRERRISMGRAARKETNRRRTHHYEIINSVDILNVPDRRECEMKEGRVHGHEMVQVHCRGRNRPRKGGRNTLFRGDGTRGEQTNSSFAEEGISSGEGNNKTGERTRNDNKGREDSGNSGTFVKTNIPKQLKWNKMKHRRVGTKEEVFKGTKRNIVPIRKVRHEQIRNIRQHKRQIGKNSS